MATWTERAKGSHQDERHEFEQLAKLMMEAQLKSRKAAKSKGVDRAFHARSIAACAGASFAFHDKPSRGRATMPLSGSPTPPQAIRRTPRRTSEAWR